MSLYFSEGDGNQGNLTPVIVIPEDGQQPSLTSQPSTTTKALPDVIKSLVDFLASRYSYFSLMPFEF